MAAADLVEGIFTPLIDMACGCLGAHEDYLLENRCLSESQMSAIFYIRANSFQDI